MSFFKSISRCFRDLFSLRRAKAPPSQTITHKAENIPNVEHVTSNRECPSSSKAGTSTQTQPIVTTSSADIDSPTARAVEGLCKPKPRSIDRQPIQNVFVRNTAGLSYIALQIVYDMSDIFPPLRSTIGGLMSLLSLAETVSANRGAASLLVRRTHALLAILERATAQVLTDGLDVYSGICEPVAHLDSTINDIQSELERICGLNRFTQIIRHREHQDQIKALIDRLDNARREFELSSSLRIQINQARHEQRLDKINSRLSFLMNCITPALLSQLFDD